MKRIAKELIHLAAVFSADDEGKDTMFGLQQWTTTDGNDFVGAGKTVKRLPPGMYEPSSDMQRGCFLRRLNIKTEEILRLPDTTSKKVVEEIDGFWGKEDEFRSVGLPYKRGIIMYGPPGTGKTCTLQLVVKDVVERGGVAMVMGNPDIFVTCMRMLKTIQPETPVVVIMEDVDSLLEQWSETQILNILDGVEAMDKVVFLATTNYPEKLGDRIMNRPSRFDRRFEVPPLNPESRRVYLNHLISKYGRDNAVDVEKWVDDTDGMSISHLKELFVATLILEDDYDEVLGFLRSMQLESPDSEGNILEKSKYGDKVAEEIDEALPQPATCPQPMSQPMSASFDYKTVRVASTMIM